MNQTSATDSFKLIKENFDSAGENGLLIGRFSCVENGILQDYLKNNNTPGKFRMKSHITACRNAGISPSTEKMLDFFCERYIEAIKGSDLISCPFYAQEEKIKFTQELKKEYCPNAKWINYDVFRTPFLYEHHQEHWIRLLEDKNVLIVSPFKTTIKEQKKKLDEIYRSCPKLIPKWKSIKILQSSLTQTLYEERSNIEDQELWKHELEKMQIEMKNMKEEFDVVLLGCGAYAMPLAFFAKSELKKIAIMYGGTLQLVFGIRGTRWNDIARYKKYINDAWVIPKEEEKPKIWKSIENGCYW